MFILDEIIMKATGMDIEAFSWEHGNSWRS